MSTQDDQKTVWLGCDRDGAGTLALTHEDDGRGVKLQAHKNGGRIVLRDRKGKDNVVIESNEGTERITTMDS